MTTIEPACGRISSESCGFARITAQSRLPSTNGGFAPSCERRAHEHDDPDAGVVMACSALGSIPTAARLGALADRIGSWNVIVGCLLLTALARVPQAFVTHRSQLAALRVLMGMTLAGLLPSTGKLVRQSVDERSSGEMLGCPQSAQFSGQVVGPVIGGQIGVALGLHSVFFVTGALLARCAALARCARNR
ncbi:MFS transporter [Burkholderia pseudomultivorans]|uniref:MFS transporter n=1 Tax=Burkholderia pseudomultivorans TaxID=1207504 RepID=UPI0022AA17D0|nr:MFS transporter [Burkholderia pseudomultivorans]